MPELPEVQTVVVTLAPHVVGRAIRRVRHARPDMLTPAGLDLRAALVGRTVAALTRRGKRIVFTLDDGKHFFIHLGMTGRLAVQAADAPIENHTHLILDLVPSTAAPAHRQRARGSSRARALPPALPLPAQQLRFRDPRRFGEIRWLGPTPGDETMGPEPLTLRPAQLAQRLRKTTRAIKNALMDQRVIAGLGNIYVDESLFAAHIHPLTPAHTLTLEQVAALTKSIKKTLRRAIRHRGSTLRDYVDANGVKGGFQQQHRVYDRAGHPCRTCRTPIERILLGGRSTHFCPNCQRPAA